jgi:hypothetical protein
MTSLLAASFADTAPGLSGRAADRLLDGSGVPQMAVLDRVR